MKTKIWTNCFLMLLFGFQALLTGCGSSGSSSSTPATTYAMTNGMCYANGSTMVATSYCSGYNTGYTYSNGQCISTTTGQIAPTTYCTSTGYGTTGIYGGYGTTTPIVTTCSGYYYYNGQLSYCAGYNCRGYTVYTVNGYQPVYCQ